MSDVLTQPQAHSTPPPGSGPNPAELNRGLDGRGGGVAVGGGDMSTHYAIVLRNEFVPAGKRSGEEEYPVRDIYFKVLPLGSADVP